MPAEKARADLTVVIPTYNRCEILRVCLERLEAQSDSNFEVLVINDGSTDGTEEVLAEAQAHSHLRIRWLTQENSGPARGRNLALAHVQTQLCILIGDDILASPTFVEAHRRLHANRPEISVVGLGLTRWDTELQQLTPFMRWIENVQFDYANLLAGATPTWQHFYTSNLSFKTKLVREARFDERFKRYGFEDVELGYRLAKANQLELVFVEEAFATHVHPTTLMHAARRMRSVGYSEHQMHEYWPATRHPVSSRWKETVIAALAKRPPALEALTRLITYTWGERQPNKLTTAILLSHHRRGYLDYAKEHNASPWGER